MNQLDYRETDAHGLSFELLVDSQPISALIGAWDTAIPYSLVESDLPTLPAYYEDYAPEIRVVAVAACCGQIGCGHARCRLVAEGDTIVFRDFAGEGSATSPQQIFRFTRSNYGAVVGAIARRSQEQWFADRKRTHAK